MKFGIPTFCGQAVGHPAYRLRGARAAGRSGGSTTLFVTRTYTRPERIREVRQWLADNGRGHVPFTVFGARGPESAGRFAEAGVERVMFMLPTMPEAETLAALDRLAAGVHSYR